MKLGRLSTREKGILAMVRLNELLGTQGINKTWNIGSWSFTFEWRSRKNLWGRFGGGWNWHVGAEWSRTTIIVFLLVCMVSIRRQRADSADAVKQ